MKATYLPPAPGIAEYVQEILVIEHFRVTTPFVLPLFPNGMPTLLFQTAKGKIGNATNNLTLFGQTVFPDTLTISEHFTLIAYFFKPYALNALFGVSAQELTDSPVDLNLLPASVRTGLQEQLLNASSSSEMISLLDNYIFRLTTKIKTDMRVIRYAVEKIAGAPSKKNLVEVQQDLYMTGRTFQRLFEKNIGIIPTQFRRISQFNAAFRQLNTRRFKSLTDISYSNGYADQSHFIRAFKEFTSMTPSQYLAW
ncbi:helix-turn-helix domain-containing protein [Chitinophaga cymbidii]|uniref:AraC family transcriptional regulator n=1 Tax=Chitinophaga cymbidii TaxID=1096750 RepID=A0A512RMS1_9BACT|nr:AraC family transcriptional regulator [Chitinophaga cymbidii]GEP96987.1 AraC family transcriptional regulator [Chitinophaga cymbidii]